MHTTIMAAELELERAEDVMDRDGSTARDERIARARLHVETAQALALVAIASALVEGKVYVGDANAI